MYKGKVTNQDGCHTTQMEIENISYMEMQYIYKNERNANWSKYDGKVNKSNWPPCDQSKTKI